jgi:CrcB protein
MLTTAVAGAGGRAVLAVAVGGALGALARVGVGALVPTAAVATLLVNVSGCFLLGVLTAVIERRSLHPLARPLLGVGVLGGYTTFSAYSLDGHWLAREGSPGLAAAYLAATVVGGLLAVVAGAAAGSRGEAQCST